MRRLNRVFWGVEETLVVAYLFIIAFGAVRPFEILPITLITAGFALLWVWHARPRHR